MLLIINLSLPKLQKLAVCATLGAGLLTCAAGLWRVWAIWNMYWGPTDEVWAVYIYWTACITEVLLACICASAPALKVCASGKVVGIDADEDSSTSTGTLRTTQHLRRRRKEHNS